MNDITILIPNFNDWQSLFTLLPKLDQALAAGGLNARVLIVDDGSTETPPSDIAQSNLRQITKVEILELTCNLGHQRAIAVGLTHVASMPGDRILVVMDGDGEDMPDDAPKLVRTLTETSGIDVVFAERLRRSESVIFRLGYAAYRFLHVILAGVRVRFGNFSAIKIGAARQLVYSGALWNHYAAAVVRSKLRYGLLPTSRGQRFAGHSKLNLAQLMGHGFSALSVFSDIVCGRLFGLAAVILLVLATSLGVMYYERHLTVPALIVFVSLAVLLLITFVLNVIALIALRSFPSFVPARDAGLFIKSVRPLWSSPVAS